MHGMGQEGCHQDFRAQQVMKKFPHPVCFFLASDDAAVNIPFKLRVRAGESSNSNNRPFSCLMARAGNISSFAPRLMAQSNDPARLSPSVFPLFKSTGISSNRIKSLSFACANSSGSRPVFWQNEGFQKANASAVRSPTAEGNLKRSRSEQRFPKSAIISAFLLASVSVTGASC